MGKFGQFLDIVFCLPQYSAGYYHFTFLFFTKEYLYFFLFLHKNISYGYSLDTHWPGAFNEYPQLMFLWRNKKKYLIDTPSYLKL